jgi:hypothetical protein
VSALLGGLVYVVHGYQVVRNAEVLLDRARRAEQENKLSQAVEALHQYLNLRKDDAQTWAWYARVLDQLTADGPVRARERVFMVHEEACVIIPVTQSSSAAVPIWPSSFGRNALPRLGSTSRSWPTARICG